MNNKMLMISILVLLVSHLITLYRLSARKREIDHLKTELGKHTDNDEAHRLRWPRLHWEELRMRMDALQEYLGISYREPRSTKPQFVKSGLIDKEAELKKEKKMESFDL